MLAIRAFLLVLVALVGLPLAAQQDPAAQRVRAFLDCNGFHCDQEFFRTEIPWVDHVRDRADADVHVLITREQTGGGGGGYTLEFVGLRRFAGVQQTLRHTAGATTTEDELRRGLARQISLGLVRYVAATETGERLSVSYAAPADAATDASPSRDPWNRWTFRIGGRGFFNGESFYRSRNLNGSVSANRVTEQWKTRLAVNASNDYDRFELNDSTSFESRREDYNASGLLVRSLGPRWSAGIQGAATRSSYANYDLLLRGGPAVEYNVFPYAESTRRQLTARYGISARRADYVDSTSFGRLEETRLEHSLTTSLDLKQRWGSVGVSLEGAHLLDDVELNRLVFFGDAEVRLVKGLSFNAFVSASRIRDQLNIRSQSGTSEEILTRQFEQLTSFRYFASVGLSYTFGSIFSNVVNPRFGGSGGGGVIIFN